MNKVKLFYLAHSFPLRSNMRKWQMMMEGEYNIEFLNPFYNNKYERDEMVKLDTIKSKKEQKEYMKSWTIDKCSGIVENDLSLIRKSDGIVAYFETPSIGTCQEIIMGALVYRIPVYIITKDCIYHPWLRYLADISSGSLFRNRTDFKKFAEKKWGKRQ